jgi:leucyl-tRNA synthetase
MDLYIGGAEHACMHLIYCRFYTMFLHDLKLIDFNEPAPRLFHQGMINDANGEKMSKSKGNVIEPLETMEKYGVDTTRFFMMSEASPDKGFNWSDKGIQGSLRFVNKFLETFDNLKFGEDSEDFEIKLNNSIKNITKQIEAIDYRKSTIELRELIDAVSIQKEISKQSAEKVLKLISPFCPHISEEVWEKLGNNKTGKNFISTEKWPEFDKTKLVKKIKDVDLNENIILYLKEPLEKLREKGQTFSKIFIYVMPFEIGRVDSKKIGKILNKEIQIYSVTDSKKFDPEEKAKKSRPGMPGFYVE